MRKNKDAARLHEMLCSWQQAAAMLEAGEVSNQSALMLVCARLRHVAGTQWGTRRYMNMDHLSKLEDDLLSDIIAG